MGPVIKILIIGVLLQPTTGFSQDSWNWSLQPDYSQLRSTFSERDDFSTRCEIGRPLKQLLKLMNTAAWSEAIRVAKLQLEKCPVDLRFHHFLGIALGKAGQSTQSNHHTRWAMGLMDSIMQSGDGKTPGTAFETISVDEEYDVLNAFALRPIKQKTIGFNGKPLDMITAANRQGREFVLYFYPKAHFERMNKIFNRGDNQTN